MNNGEFEAVDITYDRRYANSGPPNANTLYIMPPETKLKSVRFCVLYVFQYQWKSNSQLNISLTRGCEEKL